MENQMTRILKQMGATTKKGFTFKEINLYITLNKFKPEFPQPLRPADFPYYLPNYIASLLKNYCKKPKKPKIKRTLNKKGLFYYTLTKD